LNNYGMEKNEKRKGKAGKEKEEKKREGKGDPCLGPLTKERGWGKKEGDKEIKKKKPKRTPSYHLFFAMSMMVSRKG